MEKVSTKSFFWFWALLGLASVVLIWFLPWRFQTNDDELMMWMVSGAYTGEPESFAVFIHPILSWSFSKLYTFSPAIPWYPLTWFLAIYLGYFGLLKVLFQRNLANSQAKKVIAFILFCLIVHFSFFLQFTIVAGFVGLGGFSLLILGSSKIRFSQLIFPILLVSISILIRWESFVLIGLGICSYLLFLDLEFLKKKFPILTLILLLFLAGFFSRIYWEKSSSFAEFITYNKARAAVSDHPVTFRLQSEEKISPESKWFYFSQWMMEDDGISILELAERKSLLDKGLFDFRQLESSFSRLIAVLKVEAFKTIFSIILILGFFYSSVKRRLKLLFFLSWVLFFLVFNHFNILNGRVVILFVFPLIASLCSSRIYLGTKLSYLIQIGLLVILGFHLKNILQEGRGREIMRTEFLSLQKEIPRNSLIVLEGYKENYLGFDYSSNRPVPFISLGWISKSSFQRKTLNRIGLNSIFEAEDYYLFGVDVNEEFFFIDYMNLGSENYQLIEKKESDNWILFHFKKENL